MAFRIISFHGVMPHVENSCGDGGILFPFRWDLANFWWDFLGERIFGWIWGKKTTHKFLKKKDTPKRVFANFSGWWFQTFFFWGRFPIWLIFFRWVETTNQFTFTKYLLLGSSTFAQQSFWKFLESTFFTWDTYQHFVFKKEGPDPEDFKVHPPKVYKQHKNPWKMGGSKTIRLLFFGALGLFFRGETVKLQVGLIKAWISVDFFAPWYAWSYDSRSKEVRRWIQNMSEIVLFFDCFSHEQWKKAIGCLGYIGDYTTQSYGDYFTSRYKDPY